MNNLYLLHRHTAASWLGDEWILHIDNAENPTGETAADIKAMTESKSSRKLQKGAKCQISRKSNQKKARV